MTSGQALDCIVIGYNDPPFESYQQLLRSYGEHSEAYRDLRLNFVTIDGRPLNYVELLNYAVAEAAGPGPGPRPARFESGDIPNLAAAYLTSYLARRGFAAAFVNLFQQEKDALAEWLEQDPCCVAITTTFYVINFPLYEMVQFIREHNPRVRIVVGGPLIANHLRNFNEEGLQTALADIGADIYVTDAQGEATLADLVGCLKAGGDPGDVPNLAYFKGGRLVRTPARPESNSLDDNYIDWGTFPGRPLGATIQTRTARSCAFNCAFCNYPTRAGKLTLAGLATIAQELDSMRRLDGVRNVVFIDDTFNVPLPRFKDICRLMIERDYQFNWFSYFRCSNSDEEAIELMARSGCKGVFLGIESGSPAILKNMNKAATIEKYATGIRLLHDAGILTFGSFIAGFPGETDDTVAESVQFIREHRPTFYRTQLWYCEPRTPIDRQRAKFGITGDGFVWSHASMDSLKGMEHIERMFLGIDESVWLPQWSFDFWFIPYALGRGLSTTQFRDFVRRANALLALEVASVDPLRRRALQEAARNDLIDAARRWLAPSATPDVVQVVREPAPGETAAAPGAAPTPLDVESGVLARHPHIGTAAVVRTAAGEIVAYYSARAPLDAAQLRAFMRERCDTAREPGTFVQLRRVPLTLRGEVDYAALPEPGDAQARERPAAAVPRTPTEEIVARVWRSTLRLPELGIHADFRDLGGNAVLAAEILTQLRDTFQLASPLPSLNATPTVAAQALAITEMQAAQLDGEDIEQLVLEIKGLSRDTLRSVLAHEQQSDKREETCR